MMRHRTRPAVRTHAPGRAYGRVLLCAVLVCAFAPVGPGGAAAAPIPALVGIRVNASTGNDITGTGTFLKPYATIEKAVSVAETGDTIRVAPGTYYPPATIAVPNGVKLIGAGLGRTVVWGVGGPTGPVFSIINANETTRIEGLEIRGGGGSAGGAIYISGGAEPGGGPVIVRNDFIDNAVSTWGGAIFVTTEAGEPSRPNITNNTFSGNEAGTSGGAIFSVDSAPRILDNTFESNAASGSGTNGGGAIYVSGGSASIYRCTIADCDAPNGSGGGIGLNDPAANVAITECYITGNTADYGAGVWVDNSSYLTTLRNCRVESNYATGYGGGMRIYDARAAIYGCTFTGNRGPAFTPGAISIYDAGADQAVTVNTSIFHDNGGDDVAEVSSFCDLSVTYSLLQETEAGTGNLNGVDPQLTQVSAWIRRLAPTSPCIDAGKPDSNMTTDYYGLHRPKDGDGDGTARVDMGHYEYGTTIGRIAGIDRFETSCFVVGDRFEESPVVVIATGRDFPDALCASGLAGAYRAPVLLTDTNVLPDSVRDEIEYHQKREAIIVGGPSAVGDSVVAELNELGLDVTRLAGADRYETSRAVADHLADMGHMKECWIARGDAFPDALALAPYAYNTVGPVLLTRPTSLPATILEALQDYAYTQALVAGGTNAVSEPVYAQIAAARVDRHIARAYGADRYETAADVAKWATDNEVAVPEFVGLATGSNFPDALAGGAACGYERGVLLLTGSSALHPAAAAYLETNAAALREIYVLGGTGVLSDAVLAGCEEIAP